MPFEYYITLAIQIGIYSIAAIGLNITMGYAGQVNLGQAAFLGIGAMTSAILTTKLGASFWLALPLAGALAGATGVALGFISTRLRHDFLAITTIGFNFIVVYIFLYYKVFGGSYGIINIPRPELLGFKLRGIYYAILVYALLAVLAYAALRIERTWMGMAFKLLREDEEAAMSLGVDPRKYKVLAFSIGAAYGGIAGSLLAHFKTVIVYSDFEFVYSIMILSMSILGGIDSVYGGIAGAAIVILLPEVFRPLMEYRVIMYSALIVVMLLLMPSGILGKQSPITIWLKESEGRGHG
ncbi:MAG: branched-chain amino acid ABC transporter permease [Desulfurococcales archaeon]|nr:branched-chain amino acid ABC transporter permease [Desulfurococcales archaeon]